MVSYTSRSKTTIAFPFESADAAVAPASDPVRPPTCNYAGVLLVDLRLGRPRKAAISSLHTSNPFTLS
jgi:hypothetical protein